MMKKTILNLIPGIITLLFAVVLLSLRAGSTPWKNIGIVETVSIVYAIASVLFSPYLMIINYKSAAKKTAIPLYLLILAEGILLPLLMCFIVMSTKYISEDELLGVAIYMLPLAFSYIVPVAVWPMLCFLKYAKRHDRIFGNFFPCILAVALFTASLLTKLVSMDWYFAEAGIFGKRMLCLLLFLPIYFAFVNSDSGDVKNFNKRMCSSLASIVICICLYSLGISPLGAEKYVCYVVGYEAIAFIALWIYCKKKLKK